MEIGDKWLEVESNRVIVIATKNGPNSPWWYYEDDPKKTYWHCCIEDFILWDRFKRI